MLGFCLIFFVLVALGLFAIDPNFVEVWGHFPPPGEKQDRNNVLLKYEEDGSVDLVNPRG